MKTKSDGLEIRAAIGLGTALAVCLAAVFVSAPAGAGETFSSTAKPNYGVWNPGGPTQCKGFVDQYNALTPKIQAAYAKKKNDEAHRLTMQRETYKTQYQQCLDGKLVPQFNVTGSINAPGTPSTYPRPQQGYAAGPAGSLTGGASGGGRSGTATGGGPKWTGSATLPAFTTSAGVHYNEHPIEVEIGDYIHHANAKKYATKVPLTRGFGQFTHASGTVDMMAKTFTVRAMQTKTGKTVAVTPLVVRLQ